MVCFTPLQHIIQFQTNLIFTTTEKHCVTLLSITLYLLQLEVFKVVILISFDNYCTTFKECCNGSEPPQDNKSKHSLYFVSSQVGFWCHVETWHDTKCIWWSHDLFTLLSKAPLIKWLCVYSYSRYPMILWEALPMYTDTVLKLTISDVDNSKCHQQLDEIWFPPPPNIREISQVSYKKTLVRWCCMCTQS